MRSISQRIKKQGKSHPLDILNIFHKIAGNILSSGLSHTHPRQSEQYPPAEIQLKHENEHRY